MNKMFDCPYIGFVHNPFVGIRCGMKERNLQFQISYTRTNLTTFAHQHFVFGADQWHLEVK